MRVECVFYTNHRVSDVNYLSVCLRFWTHFLIYVFGRWMRDRTAQAPAAALDRLFRGVIWHTLSEHHFFRRIKHFLIFNFKMKHKYHWVRNDWGWIECHTANYYNGARVSESKFFNDFFVVIDVRAFVYSYLRYDSMPYCQVKSVSCVSTYGLCIGDKNTAIR